MSFRTLLPAVLCLVVACFPALAKPPQLPADVRDECREDNQPQTNGVILTSVKKKTAAVVEEVPAPKETKEFEDLCTLDSLCPCVSECLRRCCEAFTGKTEPAAQEQEQKPASDSVTSCPYLKDRHADNKTSKHASCGLEGDVCHNLAVLQRAKKIYRKAEKYRREGLADKAMHCYEKVQRLSPGSRYDGLASKRLKQLETPSSTESGEESEPKSQSHKEPGAALVPELPAVDPKLIDALEQVLRSAGDPACPKLMIQVDDEDPAQGHADDPVSQWPLVPFDAAVPGTLLEPAEEPAETEDTEENPPAAQMPPSADVDFVLRDVLESLAAKTCIEVDPARLGTDRPVGQIQLGPVLFRLVADDLAGWRCFLVTLKSNPNDDPRAMQRQQNERILQWIESLSGDSQSKEAASCDDEPLIEDDGDDVADS